MIGLVILGSLAVISFAVGILLNLQWFPSKDGSPPPRPLPQWLAVGIVIALVAIAVIVVFLVINR